MRGWQFLIFVSLMLFVWGTVHFYIFWRISSLPWIASHFSAGNLAIIGTTLWISYLVARVIGNWGFHVVAKPLEYAAAIWLGVAMLLLFSLLAAEAVTLGGLFLTALAPTLRGSAVIVAAVLSVIALIQGHRAPEVTTHHVTLPDLPAELEGENLAVITDLHLGTLTRHRWLKQLVEQINALRPKMILAVGDVVDGNARRIKPLLELMKPLQTESGLWAVTGNHEFYVGLAPSVALLRDAGWRVLRDESVNPKPGLVLAGVDDLTARQQFGDKTDPLETTLSPRTSGGVILMSHSPLQAERAAELGAGLMLSGHTHAGQIWPFNFLVKLRYPLLSGRYEINRMPVIVCRGTGTWGPPMRLWQRSEIINLVLHSPAAA